VNDLSPINLAYNVIGTDGDGDSASGTLSIALLPNNTDTTIGDATTQTVNGDADGNNLAGLAGVDTINGNAGNDFLLGGTGDDILVGGAGSDVLYGQIGSDTLTGGIGGADSVSDRFVFQRGDVGHGVDTITDFTLGTPASGGDVLDISDLLAGANITNFAGNEANYLVVTAGVHTTIAFDANGGNHDDAVQIATLQNVNVTLATLVGNGQIDATP
jgi:Ca2+-binding RTX toxin-like protein